jgi:hypothetical protein
MRHHPLDREMGLAGIGRPEHGGNAGAGRPFIGGCERGCRKGHILLGFLRRRWLGAYSRNEYARV